MHPDDPTTNPTKINYAAEPAEQLHRLMLLPQLRDAIDAIDAGELVVEYQPQVHALTGALVAVEALVRRSPSPP